MSTAAWGGSIGLLVLAVWLWYTRYRLRVQTDKTSIALAQAASAGLRADRLDAQLDAVVKAREARQADERAKDQDEAKSATDATAAIGFLRGSFHARKPPGSGL